MDNRLNIFAFGMLAGIAVMYFLFWPEVTEKIEYRETIVTDTVYREIRDTVRITEEKLKAVHIRDTVINELRYPINRYRGLEPTTFGDITYNALVAGRMLDLRFSTNFSLPEIHNTITKETVRTVIQKPKGIYTTGGISSEFNYSVGAVYLNDRSLFTYSYTPQLNLHQAGVGFKIF